jgi:hypothetical protein
MKDNKSLISKNNSQLTKRLAKSKINHKGKNSDRVKKAIYCGISNETCDSMFKKSRKKRGRKIKSDTTLSSSTLDSTKEKSKRESNTKKKKT